MFSDFTRSIYTGSLCKNPFKNLIRQIYHLQDNAVNKKVEKGHPIKRVFLKEKKIIINMYLVFIEAQCYY